MGEVINLYEVKRHMKEFKIPAKKAADEVIAVAKTISKLRNQYPNIPILPEGIKEHPYTDYIMDSIANDSIINRVFPPIKPKGKF